MSQFEKIITMKISPIKLEDKNLDKIVPFSSGNITIRQAREILKNQTKENTHWVSLSIPKNLSDIIQFFIEKLKIMDSK